MAQQQNYLKTDLEQRFNAIKNKTLGEIDTKHLFERVKNFPRQKGIAGNVIEQCVLLYPPNVAKQPDILVTDGNQTIPYEVKTTGVERPGKRSKIHSKFVAKEAMSITGVGVATLADENVENSHFLQKVQRLLLVYYHYDSEKTVPAYDYRLFKIKGFEFHEFSNEELQILKNDWNIVHDFVARIASEHPADEPGRSKAIVNDYLARHGILRKRLAVLELVPRKSPRFRLKKPFVSTIVAKFFSRTKLLQLPAVYTRFSDVDQKLSELSAIYKGKTVAELAAEFDIENLKDKGIAERLVVAMFGGQKAKISQIELFLKFGLIVKTVTTTASGKRTEDMKMFRADFSEMTQDIEFKKSALYEYFSDHSFLCVLFREPHAKTKNHPLSMNIFDGFSRLTFSDEFINGPVKQFWLHTRKLISENRLRLIPNLDKDGRPIINKSGSVSVSPNFMKSSQNDVFMRGSATDSSDKYKTEIVNGLKMIPQNVWIRGQRICELLQEEIPSDESDCSLQN